MGVIRVEKESNYTTMCNYHFKEKNMSLKAKGLLSWMLSLPDDWDYSIKGMAKCHKDGEDAITSTLKELKEFGYLEVNKLKPGTIIQNMDGSSYVLNRIDYEYVIHEKPINPQDTDFQCTEDSVTEFSATENQLQINTKELNTNINKKLNREKAPEPDASISVNYKHKNIYKERETLSDTLASGKDIDNQTKSKKLSAKEKLQLECLDIVEKEYDGQTRELLTEYFYFVTAIPENKENANKRVKSVSVWRKKLDRLDELVKEGYDCAKLIQQSLDNKKYVFYPLESMSHNTQNNYKNDDNIQMQTLSREEAIEEIKRRKEKYGEF